MPNFVPAQMPAPQRPPVQLPGSLGLLLYPPSSPMMIANARSNTVSTYRLLKCRDVHVRPAWGSYSLARAQHCDHRLRIQSGMAKLVRASVPIPGQFPSSVPVPLDDPKSVLATPEIDTQPVEELCLVFRQRRPLCLKFAGHSLLPRQRAFRKPIVPFSAPTPNHPGPARDRRKSARDDDPPGAARYVAHAGYTSNGRSKRKIEKMLIPHQPA